MGVGRFLNRKRDALCIGNNNIELRIVF